MKKKKFEIDRRTMLKGTGIALALPFLEIMIPSVLRAQTLPKPNIIIFLWPDGLPPYYKDSEAGLFYKDINNMDSGANGVKDFTPHYLVNHFRANMSADLKAASYLVGNSNHNWTSSGFGGHYGNSVGILTGGIDKRKYSSFDAFKNSGSNGDDFMMETFDQRIARHFGLKTLNALGAPGAGSIETFANRRTVESISWYKSNDGQTVRPVYLDKQPRELFDRIVGGEVMTDQASIEARKRILQNKDTILSAVLEDIKKLQGRLGYEDKMRLEDYLTGVRELDSKTAAEVNNINNELSKTCNSTMTRPGEFNHTSGGSATEYFKKLDLFRDLMTLSMECEMNHVHAISMAGSGSGLYLRSSRDVPNGMPGYYHSWHAMSHWKFAGGGTESFDNVTAAEAEAHKRYQRETYAEYAMQATDYFKDWMERLIQKKRADGSTIFDNTFACATSFIGDGNSHSRNGIPVLMAGTAGGRIPKHNGHNFTTSSVWGIQKGNIWLSVLKAMGINISSFGGEGGLGGSTGELPDFNKPHSS